MQTNVNLGDNGGGHLLQTYPHLESMLNNISTARSMKAKLLIAKKILKFMQVGTLCL